MGIDFVTATELHPLVCYKRGKVRDIYEVGDRLLIVATDRISAFDVVLLTGIPDKGRVLTELSRFWFSRTRDIVPNHFLTTGEAACRPFGDWRGSRGRCIPPGAAVPSGRA